MGAFYDENAFFKREADTISVQAKEMELWIKAHAICIAC